MKHLILLLITTLAFTSAHAQYISTTGHTIANGEIYDFKKTYYVDIDRNQIDVYNDSESYTFEIKGISKGKKRFGKIKRFRVEENGEELKVYFDTHERATGEYALIVDRGTGTVVFYKLEKLSHESK